MADKTKTKNPIQAADDPTNKLLITIVNRGFAEEVIAHSRSCGATGATILHGRGSAGVGEQFLGMNITPEKEIVLIVLKAEIANMVQKSIAEHSGMTTAAGGICFCVPVNHLTKLKQKSDASPKEEPSESAF